MTWTLAGLLGAAGLQATLDGEDVVLGGLSYDSREAAKGDLFCCISGERADGHDHAPEAVGKGAAALLVERRLDIPISQARVASVREVLGPLADAFFGSPSVHMDVAAVTGTNGKTTITYLLESIGRAAGRSTGVVGTVTRRFAGTVEPAARNTPEAIDLQRLLGRMREAGVDLVALEATSDGLAQGRMRGTRVRTAGFTNLTQDHLNTHGSMDAYFAAKCLLFSTAYTARAVVNTDDPYGRSLAERVRSELDVTTYGEGGDISCTDVRLDATGSSAVMHTPAGSFAISTHLVGRYNISNCMCAAGMALDCGIDPENIAAGITALASVPGRLQRIEAGQSFLALVDYAHSPDALEQALLASRELATDRVIVVFGCGGDRDRAKRPLMGEVATRLADLSLVTSDNPRSEDPERIVADIEVGARKGGNAFRSVVDRRTAIAEAIAEAREGDVVLVAGKGHEQGQQFADRTVPFDDADVVRWALEELACRR